MTAGILLDTHALLWVLADEPKLSQRAREVIRSRDSPLIVSIASVWEIVLKHQAGKVRFKVQFGDLLDYVLFSGEWSVLPILSAHIVAAVALPPLHRDPFDRILIAQAQVERLEILTADKEISRYGVAAVW